MARPRIQMSMTIHRHRATSHSRAPVGTADIGAILTIVQVCFCVVALVVVFTLQFVAPQWFSLTGEAYKAVMGGGEGEAMFVGAFGQPITKETLTEAAQKLLETLPPLPLGQGGESANVPKNLYLGPIALMAAPTYPAYGVITSNFGVRNHPITRKVDFHTGLDIAAPMGSAVYAALPGTVTEVGQSPIYGNFLRLSHGKNLETVYNHCSEILATPGAVVRRGERIALVGSTGISTGSHLHFDLLVNGCYTDPLQMFRVSAND